MVHTMSENLKMLGEYSNAMFTGDTEAVYDFWSPDFVSHVTARVAPGRVGSDVRGDEQEWWTRSWPPCPTWSSPWSSSSSPTTWSCPTGPVRGTHTGAPFFDVPPSGEPVHINGTAILRIRDGKIVEHWGGPHCQKGLGLIR